MTELDLKALGLRAINERINTPNAHQDSETWTITNPMGQHAIACGLQSPIHVDVMGHAGFYCGGMNQHASITVHGHAGVGVAENMMSGSVMLAC